MWKAAFTGRSESGSQADGLRRKKSSGRAESVASAPASRRRRDEEDKDRKKSSHSSQHRSSRSAYGVDESGSSTAYVTAPSSRAGTGALTESAVNALNAQEDDEDDWVDDDAKTERTTGTERRRKRKSHSHREKERSSSGERERAREKERERKERERKEEKRRESLKESLRDAGWGSGGRSEKSKTKERSKTVEEDVDGPSTRALPAMGSFEQFPGQYSGVIPGPVEPVEPVEQPSEPRMSGALPPSDPAHQFPNQIPASYDRPQMGPTRADSYGAAADYYMDEGQSVNHQPGVRSITPNMLVNPDAHLLAASAEAHPAPDTGHGLAAEFYNGDVNPVEAPKPSSSSKSSSSKPSSSSVKPSKSSKQSSGSFAKPLKTSKTASTAAAIAAATGTIGLVNAASHQHTQSQPQMSTTSSPYQQAASSTRPHSKPSRHDSAPDAYHPTPSSGRAPLSDQRTPSSSRIHRQGLQSDDSYRPLPYQPDPRMESMGESSRKHPSQSTNVPLYVAGTAAAGHAAYEASQDRHYSSQYNSTSRHGGSGGGGHGPPRPPIASGSGPPMNGSGGHLAQQYYPHAHKGPISKLKDGLLNLISDPEDVQKMEEYTEYIGVCKYCFDPRSSPYMAPRKHHYHPHRSRDSFEDLRRRRSNERLYRKSSNDSLRRGGSTRIDKESRYYTESGMRRSGGKSDLLAAGLAGGGIAAGANAMFGDRKDFDDTYSVKSGHRASSAVRRRSRSSSRERRRRSSHGVVDGSGRDNYVIIRTKGGRVEKRRVHESRSRSNDRRTGFEDLAAGSALGAEASAAMSDAARHRRGKSPQGMYVRRHERSRSRSYSPGLGEILGFTTSKSKGSGRHSPDRSYFDSFHPGRKQEESDGFFRSFFSPSQNEKKLRRRPSREHRKRKTGFFTFSNGSASSSDADMAFGDVFASKTSLPLRRKKSGHRARRSSSEHLAATMAGIGATAAALAAAQKGHRVSKRTSRAELGPGRDVKLRQHRASSEHVHGLSGSSGEDGWEDELPSDADDASSTHSGLAFGEPRLSHRPSTESVGSGNGLSAWGWRWRGTEKRRRNGQPPAYEQRPGRSYVRPTVDDATDSVVHDESYMPFGHDSSHTASSTGYQQPLQHVDPRPLSDASSKHGTMPGGWNEPPVIRPGPGPIQQPQPVAPVSPAFVSSPPEIDGRPRPKRTTSSPARPSFGFEDAALIGAGALAAGSIIAGASGRRSKEPSNVRFGLTQEQQRKEEREKRRELERAEDERRRADRTRALKEEAERTAKESDIRLREEEVRRRREEDNRRAAEAKIAAQRKAEEQAELDRRRREVERVEQENAYHREQQLLAEARRQQEESKRQREAMAAKEAAENEANKAERERREKREAKAREERERQEAIARREAEVQAEIERRQRELDEQKRWEREHEERQRREFERQEAERAQRRSKSDRSTVVGAYDYSGVTDPFRYQVQDDDTSAQRKSKSETGRREKEADPKSSMGWGSVAMGAAAAATAGAVLAGAAHSRSREEDRSRQQEYDQYPEGQALYHPIQDDRQKTADLYAAKQVLPEDAASGAPIMDDDIFDKDFFKNRQRSNSEHQRHEEIARIAAAKVVADMDEYYKQPAPSPAEFFRPAILDEPSAGKTKVADPISDNEVQVYHAADDEIRSHFSGSGRRSETFSKSRHAPYGVPALKVIAPTPPPAERTSSKSIWSPPAASPLARSETSETQADAVADKRDRSRSISWGVDSTHVYDPPTPESFPERESYMHANDVPRDVPAQPLDEVVVEEEKAGSASEKTRYKADDLSGLEQTTPRENTDFDEVEDMPRETPPFYRQPFFESVSDFSMRVDSPGTEGAPPVRGFVEGEIDEPTPIDEKTPHIPGGFDDEVYEGFTPGVPRDDHDTKSADPEEPAWEPPLSKKEKKRREKAAKRSESLDFQEPAADTPSEDTPTASAPARTPQAEPEDYFLSKKDRKKRDKAIKRQSVDVASPIEDTPIAKDILEETPSESTLPIEADLPKLSKKEQKKRDKEARKSGFADVAETLMTAGGIAALVSAATSNQEPGEDEWPSSSDKKSKKQGKKSKEPDSDSPEPEAAVSTPEVESSTPGGWNPSGTDSPPSEKMPEAQEAPVDPFAYQVKDEPKTASTEADPADEWADTSKKSKKKKSKRDSGRFNEPAASSPLRSEWNYNDYVGEEAAAQAFAANTALPETPIAEYSEDKIQDFAGKTDVAALPRSDSWADQMDRADKESARSQSDERRATDSSRRRSPEDGRSRSVASEPMLGGRSEKRSSKSSKTRSEVGYADDPDYYDDSKSVAVSEPADLYESRAAKRRSKRDDDDTASVVSSRSRREKEESSSSSKKEKKGGLFGLFSRKSSDAVVTKSSMKSDDAALSRTSTRDSRDGEGEDGERKHRRKKHRDGSTYDNDDDDARSVASESRRKHRSHREDRDEDSRERRRSSRYGDDDFGDTRSELRRSSRHGDDDFEDAKSEPGGRRHRHRSEDGDTRGESGRRHHHRRRTDDGAYDGQDKSFLGIRVEDLPPLPASPPSESSVAAMQTTEQEHGSPVSAATGTRDVAPIEGPSGFRHEEAAQDIEASSQSSTLAIEEPEAPEALPALPSSRPGSPTWALQTPCKPPALVRPTSSTAVPLRFPFGHSPQHPPTPKTRALSFGSSVQSSTPATPTSSQKKSRPTSSEMRPLYLVERNTKTPEVEERLPSLPSSQPSSRASSVHGSDDWHSAAEDQPSSPERGQSLVIDTGRANDYNPDEHHGDYLGSEHSTPKASSFPLTAVHTSPEKPGRPQPQFYTWADFEQDERLHSADVPTPDRDPMEELSRTETLQKPILEPAFEPNVAITHSDVTPSDADIPVTQEQESHRHKPSPKGIAAAAMLGSAAVYAGSVLARDGSAERSEGPSHDHSGETTHDYPLPAPREERSSKPAEESQAAEEPIARLSLARSSSSKKGKKGKKGKVSVKEESKTVSEEVPVAVSESQPLEPVKADDQRVAESQAQAGDVVKESGSVARQEIAPDLSTIDDHCEQQDRSIPAIELQAGNPEAALQPSNSGLADMSERTAVDILPTESPAKPSTDSQSSNMPHDSASTQGKPSVDAASRPPEEAMAESKPQLTRKESKKNKKKKSLPSADSEELQESTQASKGQYDVRSISVMPVANDTAVDATPDDRLESLSRASDPIDGSTHDVHGTAGLVTNTEAAALSLGESQQYSSMFSDEKSREQQAENRDQQAAGDSHESQDLAAPATEQPLSADHEQKMAENVPLPDDSKDVAEQAPAMPEQSSTAAGDLRHRPVESPVIADDPSHELSLKDEPLCAENVPLSEVEDVAPAVSSEQTAIETDPSANELESARDVPLPDVNDDDLVIPAEQAATEVTSSAIESVGAEDVPLPDVKDDDLAMPAEVPKWGVVNKTADWDRSVEPMEAGTEHGDPGQEDQRHEGTPQPVDLITASSIQDNANSRNHDDTPPVSTQTNKVDLTNPDDDSAWTTNMTKPKKGKKKEKTSKSTSPLVEETAAPIGSSPGIVRSEAQDHTSTSVAEDTQKPVSEAEDFFAAPASNMTRNKAKKEAAREAEPEHIARTLQVVPRSAAEQEVVAEIVPPVSQQEDLSGSAVPAEASEPEKAWTQTAPKKKGKKGKKSKQDSWEPDPEPIEPDEQPTDKRNVDAERQDQPPDNPDALAGYHLTTSDARASGVSQEPPADLSAEGAGSEETKPQVSERAEDSWAMPSKKKSKKGKKSKQVTTWDVLDSEQRQDESLIAAPESVQAPDDTKVTEHSTAEADSTPQSAEDNSSGEQSAELTTAQKSMDKADEQPEKRSSEIQTEPSIDEPPNDQHVNEEKKTEISEPELLHIGTPGDEKPSGDPSKEDELPKDAQAEEIWADLPTKKKGKRGKKAKTAVTSGPASGSQEVFGHEAAVASASASEPPSQDLGLGDHTASEREIVQDNSQDAPLERSSEPSQEPTTPADADDIWDLQSSKKKKGKKGKKSQDASSIEEKTQPPDAEMSEADAPAAISQDAGSQNESSQHVLISASPPVDVSTPAEPELDVLAQTETPAEESWTQPTSGKKKGKKMKTPSISFNLEEPPVSTKDGSLAPSSDKAPQEDSAAIGEVAELSVEQPESSSAELASGGKIDAEDTREQQTALIESRALLQDNRDDLPGENTEPENLYSEHDEDACLGIAESGLIDEPREQRQDEADHPTVEEDEPHSASAFVEPTTSSSDPSLDASSVEQQPAPDTSVPPDDDWGGFAKAGKKKKKKVKQGQPAEEKFSSGATTPAVEDTPPLGSTNPEEIAVPSGATDLEPRSQESQALPQEKIWPEDQAQQEPQEDCTIGLSNKKKKKAKKGKEAAADELSAPSKDDADTEPTSGFENAGQAAVPIAIPSGDTWSEQPAGRKGKKGKKSKRMSDWTKPDTPSGVPEHVELATVKEPAASDAGNGDGPSTLNLATQQPLPSADDEDLAEGGDRTTDLTAEVPLPAAEESDLPRDGDSTLDLATQVALPVADDFNFAGSGEATIDLAAEIPLPAADDSDLAEHGGSSQTQLGKELSPRESATLGQPAREAESSTTPAAHESADAQEKPADAAPIEMSVAQGEVQPESLLSSQGPSGDGETKDLISTPTKKNNKKKKKKGKKGLLSADDTQMDQPSETASLPRSEGFGESDSQSAGEIGKDISTEEVAAAAVLSAAAVAVVHAPQAEERESNLESKADQVTERDQTPKVSEPADRSAENLDTSALLAEEVAEQNDSGAKIAQDEAAPGEDKNVGPDTENVQGDAVIQAPLETARQSPTGDAAVALKTAPEDEWAAFSTKKSKKDKKKAKKTGTAAKPTEDNVRSSSARGASPAASFSESQLPSKPDAFEAHVAAHDEPVVTPGVDSVDVISQGRDNNLGSGLAPVDENTVPVYDEWSDISPKSAAKGDLQTSTDQHADIKGSTDIEAAEPETFATDTRPAATEKMSMPTQSLHEADVTQKALAAADEDIIWTAPLKKSKKEKRKAKKSGQSTASRPVDTDEVTVGEDHRKLSAIEQIGRSPSGVADANAVSGSDEATQAELNTTLGDSTDVSGKDNAVDKNAPAPAHDIDFAATLAAGLADSGFNPDLVVNDPAFHRRASAPGQVAEADPDEVFETTTKRRGKKSSAESLQVERAGEQSTDLPPSADPIDPREDVPQSGDHNDLNSAIADSLRGAGFDPNLLDQAMASNNNKSSLNELGGDDTDFVPTVSKRKKKTPNRLSQIEQNLTAPLQRSPDSGAEQSVIGTAAQAQSSSGLESAVDAAPPNAEHGDTAPTEAEVQRSADVRELLQTTDDLGKPQPGDPSAVEDPTGGFVMAGDRDMDVDEMDKAYSAYKRREKRKKKKQRADRAEGLDEQNTAESLPKPSHDPSESRAEAQQPSATHRPEVNEAEAVPSLDLSEPAVLIEQPQGPPSPTTSRVQSVFPGLARVKRRQMSGSGGSASPRPLQSAEDSPLLPRAVSKEVSQSETNDADPSGSTKYPDALLAIGAGVLSAGLAARQALHSGQSNNGGGTHESLPAANDAWSFKVLGEHDRSSAPAQEEQRETALDSDNQGPDMPGSHALQQSASRESLHRRRSAEPLHINTEKTSEWNLHTPKKRTAEYETAGLSLARTLSRETPLESTTKNRASYLFQSPPAHSDASQKSVSTDTTPAMMHGTPEASSARRDGPTLSPPPDGALSPRTPLDSIPEEHGSKRHKASSDVGGPASIKAIRRTETPQAIRTSRLEKQIDVSGQRPLRPSESLARSSLDPTSAEQVINNLSRRSVDEDKETVNIHRSLGQRASKPNMGADPMSPSATSIRSLSSTGQRMKSPEGVRPFSRTSNRSSTPTLRRIDRSLSGDLRAASRRGDSGSAVGGASPKTIPFEPPPTPPLQDEDVIAGTAAGAAAMSDVFVGRSHSQTVNVPDIVMQQGYGDARELQASPTRPPSVRKRQSMHIVDLETRLDQLTAENRALQEAKAGLHSDGHDTQAMQEALHARDLQLQEKDVEISRIKAMLQPMQEEIGRLTEVNGGLTEANRNLVDDTNGRYAILQQEHAHANEQWQNASRELENVRQEHSRLASGMRAAVEAQLATALADKNAEILRLREELDIATEQIRALQKQIQSSRKSDYLTVRDEDYFDGACQKLCQHVQQWVLRFSKLSDNRICRLSTDLKDDKLEARLDNAVLDGSDVDKLLCDRVRRRDVFMSVVMTMVWEYIFTRYLFGMDREQRQKLKALEKILAEVGPPRAVAQWRATTLTLLSKRPDFSRQCTLDTEAVAHEIFGLLCSLLPPSSSAEQQLLASLQKVIGVAVDLSIEMRTQRAEYIMLPPLQPEYDTNGDLVRKVHFNASLMNERSGMFSSNEELEQDRAVVKIVLFPLVVKKGDESGEGEDEIVVCPAQVLIQNDNGKGKKVVRVMSGAMEIDDPRGSRQSLLSARPGSSMAY
ncbi:microtubule-associated protein futsch-like [Teratosphaeria destructans]|uniref:Microtubule-associated protein futsch-like n=1 Tax=Teratosphaeria destructans TaxID=418781 RepID=A0A9W7SLH1_9PEZI|nr:microtubule-associated protein futsch-like [Teratosphaeria destructans]